MPKYPAPSPEALNVSAFIFERLRKLAPVETLKLQKLMYYSNAWSLAGWGKPLFEDEIQAWKHGPVVSSLYPLHRGRVALDDWPHGERSKLSIAERKLVDNIVSTYGGLSGWSLRERTHKEKPWIDAWEKSKHGKILRVPIEPEAMSKYYSAFLGD